MQSLLGYARLDRGNHWCDGKSESWSIGPLLSCRGLGCIFGSLLESCFGTQDAA